MCGTTSDGLPWCSPWWSGSVSFPLSLLRACARGKVLTQLVSFSILPNYMFWQTFPASEERLQNKQNLETWTADKWTNDNAPGPDAWDKRRTYLDVLWLLFISADPTWGCRNTYRTKAGFSHSVAIMDKIGGWCRPMDMITVGV